MSNSAKRIFTPFTSELVESLKIGDRILLSGILYTLTESSAQKLMGRLQIDNRHPFELRGQVILFTEPAPNQPGEIIGQINPLAAHKFNSCALKLIFLGLKGLIGRGPVSNEVQDAMKQHKTIYFAATAGAGVLLREFVTGAEVVALADLGNQAIRKLAVRDFPVTVSQDCQGGNLFEEGRKKYGQPEPG